MVLLPVITFALSSVILQGPFLKKIFCFVLKFILLTRYRDEKKIFILLTRYRDDPTIIPPTVKNWVVPRT